ncbi:hypothetical protein DXG01_011028 [Tephrocybe rancida]|nr:hypothetical protein DXG01_011028 [Tephrocybe rancida]
MDDSSNKRSRSDSELQKENAETRDPPLNPNTPVSKITKPACPSTNVSQVHKSHNAALKFATQVTFHSTEGLSQGFRIAFDLNNALGKSRQISDIWVHYNHLRRTGPSKRETSGCELTGEYPIGIFDNDPIKKLYDNDTVSGYGDNRFLETKVDQIVRDAREIKSEEFSVQPELLECICTSWEEDFTMHGRVCVAPYKIYIYNRDTPEVGLVDVSTWAWRLDTIKRL